MYGAVKGEIRKKRFNTELERLYGEGGILVEVKNGTINLVGLLCNGPK